MKTMELRTLFAASALSLGVAQASAATAIGEYATFSGFGTTGVVVTDYDDAEYVRYGQPSGATKTPEFKVDSNLGLQLNARANDWLSGTVQLLTQQRYEKNMDTEVEWAFVGLEPVDGLRVRVGRMAMPVFAISDTRNVGFANNWARPPQEVYGLAMLDRLDGVDISYRLSLGDHAVTMTALAGEAEANTYSTTIDQDIVGATVEWESPWATFRLGHIEGDPDLASIGYAGLDDTYTFQGVGAFIERDRLVARTEYVRRSSDEFGAIVDASGWYVFGGYRFGSFLPYAMYATTEPDGEYLPIAPAGEQTTLSAGVRWDAFSSASIKFQLDRVDTNDTHGISFVTERIPLPFGEAALPVTDDVMVASLAVDFVF